MNLLQASEIMRRGEKIPRRQQAGLVIALSGSGDLGAAGLDADELYRHGDGRQPGVFRDGVHRRCRQYDVVVERARERCGGWSFCSGRPVSGGGGTGDEDSRDVLCQAILFNAAFGAALAVLAVLAGQFLPAALGAEAALRPYARAYFCTVAAFLPFQHGLRILLQHPAVQRGACVPPSVLNVGMCLLDMLFKLPFDLPDAANRRCHRLGERGSASPGRPWGRGWPRRVSA